MSQENRTSSVEFELLTGKILEAHGYKICPNQNRNSKFDFIAELNKEIQATEVKFYRTDRAQMSLINRAASLLKDAMQDQKIEKGLLIISCYLPPEFRLLIEKKYNKISFFDRFDLLNLADISPAFSSRLRSVLESPNLNLTNRPLPRQQLDLQTNGGNGGDNDDTKEDNGGNSENGGDSLCQKLKSLPPGRGSWGQYESLCIDILKYLFFTQLHGWHKQQRTTDGLNRFDLICRALPATDFWQFSQQHLNSRYVLFEFKNYKDKINQGEILTTEKYLLEKGLRTLGIIMTRQGANDSAKKMAAGAMREHGKLMLVLDDDLVCEMLHMKDRGEDPSDKLFDLADSFLLELSR